MLIIALSAMKMIAASVALGRWKSDPVSVSDTSMTTTHETALCTADSAPSCAMSAVRENDPDGTHEPVTAPTTDCAARATSSCVASTLMLCFEPTALPTLIVRMYVTSATVTAGEAISVMRAIVMGGSCGTYNPDGMSPMTPRPAFFANWAHAMTVVRMSTTSCSGWGSAASP